jgi:hypothetical protein
MGHLAFVVASWSPEWLTLCSLWVRAELSPENAVLLRVRDDVLLQFDPTRCGYLRYHRKTFDELESHVSPSSEATADALNELDRKAHGTPVAGPAEPARG